MNRSGNLLTGNVGDRRTNYFVWRELDYLIADAANRKDGLGGQVTAELVIGENECDRLPHLTTGKWVA